MRKDLIMSEHIGRNPKIGRTTETLLKKTLLKETDSRSRREAVQRAQRRLRVQLRAALAAPEMFEIWKNLSLRERLAFERFVATILADVLSIFDGQAMTRLELAREVHNTFAGARPPKRDE